MNLLSVTNACFVEKAIKAYLSYHFAVYRFPNFVLPVVEAKMI
jgi:hypothetical protein